MFTRYKHHGVMVWVRTDLKGLHREHCLCYSCDHFHPNTPENCPLAQEIYEMCKREGMTLPVWECLRFDEATGEKPE